MIIKVQESTGDITFKETNSNKIKILYIKDTQDYITVDTLRQNLLSAAKIINNRKLQYKLRTLNEFRSSGIKLFVLGAAAVVKINKIVFFEHII